MFPGDLLLLPRREGRKKRQNAWPARPGENDGPRETLALGPLSCPVFLFPGFSLFPVVFRPLPLFFPNRIWQPGGCRGTQRRHYLPPAADGPEPESGKLRALVSFSFSSCFCFLASRLFFVHVLTECAFSGFSSRAFTTLVMALFVMGNQGRSRKTEGIRDLCSPPAMGASGENPDFCP